MAEKTTHLTLPITGMTCANCVATIERNLKKLEGVRSASVNLSSERASVEFDPRQLDQQAVIGRIRRAGYDIAQGEADLLIRRLGDDNDARRLEKALLSLDGVTEASVILAREIARVKYIPTVVSQAEIRRAVGAEGFEAVASQGKVEDVERQARQREIKRQQHLLLVGSVFTVLCSCSPCCGISA
jgi:Cu+-exporting ATPase